MESNDVPACFSFKGGMQPIFKLDTHNLPEVFSTYKG